MRAVTLIKIDGEFFLKGIGSKLNMFNAPIYARDFEYLEAFPVNEFSLAHDLFHHLNYKFIGTLSDEIMAIGGMLFVNRHLSDKITMRSMIAEIEGLFEFHTRNPKIKHLKIQKRKRLNKNLFNKISDNLNTLKNDFLSAKNNYDYQDNFEKEEYILEVENFLKSSACLVYDGYIKSSQKYKNNNEKAYYNYQAVMETTKKILRYKDHISDDCEITLRYGDGLCFAGGEEVKNFCI